jgi:DNA-binding transcriptional MerR regulator
MAAVKGKRRSISEASMETNVVVTTLRAWDEFVQPQREGRLRERYYYDSHIARILKMLELNKASKAAASRKPPEALRA